MKKDQFFNKLQQQSISQQEIERKWRVLQEQEAMQKLWEAVQRPTHAQYSPMSTGGGGGIPLYLTTTAGLVTSFDNIAALLTGTSAIPDQEPFPAFTFCCDRGAGSFYFLFSPDAGVWVIGHMNMSDGSYVTYDNNIVDVAQKLPYALYLEPGGSLIMVDDKMKKSDYQNIIRIGIDEELETATASLVSESATVDGYILSLFTYNGTVWGVSNDKIGFVIGPYNIETPGFDDLPARLHTYVNGEEVPFNFPIGNFQQATDGNAYMNALYESGSTGFFIVNMAQYEIDGDVQANFIKSSTYDDGNFQFTAMTMFNVTN